MDVGEMFDWMGRIFGIAFLLFMLSVLFFPSWRELEADPEEPRAERSEEPAFQPQPELMSPPELEQERGTVLSFPPRRRAHR